MSWLRIFFPAKYHLSLILCFLFSLIILKAATLLCKIVQLLVEFFLLRFALVASPYFSKLDHFLAAENGTELRNIEFKAERWMKKNRCKCLPHLYQKTCLVIISKRCVILMKVRSYVLWWKMKTTRNVIKYFFQKKQTLHRPLLWFLINCTNRNHPPTTFTITSILLSLSIIMSAHNNFLYIGCSKSPKNGKIYHLMEKMFFIFVSRAKSEWFLLLIFIWKISWKLEIFDFDLASLLWAKVCLLMFYKVL